MVRVQLDRTVTVNEGGKPKKMKMRQVISQAQINAAAKGNVYAQKEVMKAGRDIEARDAERALVAAAQRKAEREEEIATYYHMVKYKAIRAAKWAEADVEGKKPDDPWPHPEDILLFSDTQRWRWRGPVGESDLPVFNWYRAERDYLFAYGILDSLERKKPSRSWQDMLGELGYKVIEASSAEEALQLMGAGLKPDLIVTDHLMPGMNGVELARTIQAQDKRVRILIASGYAEIEGLDVELPRLTKPFRKDELAASVAALWETAQVAR